ncbi:kinetochore-associated protein DSN1 homolog isoform X2 [Sinocyclocheilus anshuiensis]|uniref:kinetochore-associated protein DSN1 homolog isoform X2 n=1 Tax=Sinocyclocheilus anshuiensis TaxID=1608454 RepID=UPI0007B91BDA|nr:PREDICTED: kinetochore-associated protein DSN1 homolog isoform X2 [Sinocyclocheilus anshuiensis]
MFSIDMWFDASNISITRASEVSNGVKRPHNSNHISGPPQKSPCTSPAPETMQHLGEEEQPEDSKMSSVEDRMRESVTVTAPERSPRSRRKSWRRSSRGRRSLPAFSSSSQPLCETISLSLPDNERLEMLIKAAMQRTVKRAKNSLNTVPGVDAETLQAQVESLNEEWDSLTKDIRRETQNSLPTVESDPVVNVTTARIQEDINRLQAESMSWESLLNKHRSKADELDKCVERGEEKGVPLDPSCFAKSSQSQLILNKPDYKAVLMGQQKLLRNMELVMDSQCCIMRELLSFHEKSQLLLMETSTRLASRAGFQNLPSSPVRQLIKGPISSVSS